MGADARAVDAQANTTNPFGTYLSAKEAALQHDLGDAARLYQQSLADNPDDPNVIDHAFLYTAAAGDVAKAVDLAAKVVAVTPEDRAARLALAIGALKKGDYREARKELSQSGKGPFTTLTMFLVDGWAAQGAGDIDAALKDMDAMAGVGGTPSLVSFHKALILDLAGRDADAD